MSSHMKLPLPTRNNIPRYHALVGYWHSICRDIPCQMSFWTLRKLIWYLTWAVSKHSLVNDPDNQNHRNQNGHCPVDFNSSQFWEWGSFSVFRSTFHTSPGAVRWAARSTDTTPRSLKSPGGQSPCEVHYFGWDSSQQVSQSTLVPHSISKFCRKRLASQLIEHDNPSQSFSSPF